MISVRGPDSQSFLQGLMTQDINMFKKDGSERAAIFTTFLNVKGKIIFDAILAKPLIANQKDDDMEYWMEVAQEDQETALKHLKVNCLLSNVSLLEICHQKKGAGTRRVAHYEILLGADISWCRLQRRDVFPRPLI